MRVSGLMSRDVVTIVDTETCYDPVDRMCLRRLLVLDSDGLLVGIVTDRDVRHRPFTSDVYHRVGEVPVSTLLRQAPVRVVTSAAV